MMNINIDDIETFFSNQNLDIKVKGSNPRFTDQKCTPDILSFIADMILEFNKESFTAKDIWNFPVFMKLMTNVFQKPSPENKTARNEYNKFIGQSLSLLSYAGVLKGEKIGRATSYNILRKDILEYIALKERNAFFFLNAYFNKFIIDNGQSDFFKQFFEKQTPESFTFLKEKFINFMLKNTGIGSRGSSGRTEIRRILPKLLNILAVSQNKKGVVWGRLSKGRMTYTELMYNRENFRDKGKDKGITRQEEAALRDYSTTGKYNDYLIKKAKDYVRKLHHESEVHDNLHGRTDHIHHIFPQNKFKALSTYVENLIALSAGQHLSKAHPNGNTREIDIGYQCVCLLAKSQTIENHLKKGIKSYSKESFIHVINTGFKWLDTDSEMKSRNSFQEINDAVTKHYKYS